MLYMSCVDLTHFLCMALSAPFQPAVPIIDERRDDLVWGSAHFFFQGLDSRM